MYTRNGAVSRAASLDECIRVCAHVHCALWLAGWQTEREVVCVAGMRGRKRVTTTSNDGKGREYG
jgi:hypothetical protein